MEANAQQKPRGLAKIREGVVTSNKMDKTATVLVSSKVRHPGYHKYMTRSKKYHAHDAGNECQIGDRVLIIETRPLSKSKRWRIHQVVERAA